MGCACRFRTYLLLSMNVLRDDLQSLRKNDPLVTLSVFTPCYDEQDVLPAFYKRVIEVCRKFDSYELVLVDDGSTDGTWSAIRSLVGNNPHVVGLRLARNHGHQLALTAGLANATGNRVLIIDADLQDPPELLFAMMDLLEKGADVVYRQRAGSR